MNKRRDSNVRGEREEPRMGGIAQKSSDGN